MGTKAACFPGPRRVRRRASQGLALGVLVVGFAFGLIGCGEPVPSNSVASRKLRAPTARVQKSPPANGHDEAALHFTTFALNALLVSLLDDDWPPRWADPALSFDCDAVEVTVDGAPLDSGAPVQEGGFTVRWRMQRCMPFEERLELTGDIELKVEPSGAGYRALVQPLGLHVVSAHGRQVLTEAFAARMSLGR